MTVHQCCCENIKIDAGGTKASSTERHKTDVTGFGVGRPADTQRTADTSLGGSNESGQPSAYSTTLVPACHRLKTKQVHLSVPCPTLDQSAKYCHDRKIVTWEVVSRENGC